MARKRYSAEQIIGHLRQAEILISEGKTIGEAARQLSISEQTSYRWRREYGGMVGAVRASAQMDGDIKTTSVLEGPGGGPIHGQLDLSSVPLSVQSC